jgi:hypothetical protein
MVHIGFSMRLFLFRNHKNEQITMSKEESKTTKDESKHHVLTSKDVLEGTEADEGYLSIEEKNRRRNEGQTAVTYTEKDGIVKEKIADPGKTTDPKKTDTR